MEGWKNGRRGRKGWKDGNPIFSRTDKFRRRLKRSHRWKFLMLVAPIDRDFASLNLDLSNHYGYNKRMFDEVQITQKSLRGAKR